MALVTIGVPVYNGAKMIGECLDCLTNQTLRDIEIIVSDNASTDDTARIVQDYAARDSRIRHIRQPRNIGLMANFKAVVDAAGSPYFILRCHDDLSSLNYSEALYEGLKAKSGARVAVPNIEFRHPDRPVTLRAVPALTTGGDLTNIRTLLFESQSAWFCGLWETAAFRPVFGRVWQRYHSPWGPDHLTLYPFLISQAVALVPEAKFIQRVTRKEGDAAYAKPKLREMLELRRIFLEGCREFRQEQKISGSKEAALAALTWLHAGKRIFKARNIVRYALLGRW